ncbi:MAG: hypothetical protein R6W77_14620 [Trueperaceae bacterium]
MQDTLRSSRNDLAAVVALALVAALWAAGWRGSAPDGWVWVAMRLSGVVGYVALAFTVALGALTRSRYLPGWLAKPVQFGWHGVLSGTGLVLMAAHVALTLVDTAYPQTLRGVLVPGLATYLPVALAFGTLAAYAMVVPYVSYAFKRRLAPTWVRGLHLFAYPAFALATFHGVMAGSDRLPWLYPSALAVVTAATAVRLLERRGGSAGSAGNRPRGPEPRPDSGPGSRDARA